MSGSAHRRYRPTVAVLLALAAAAAASVLLVPGAVSVATAGVGGIDVVKVADSTAVSAGDQIGFTVTLSNTDSVEADGLQFTDPLPTGGGSLSWSISPSSAGWSIANGNLVYSPTTLAGGAATSAHMIATTTRDDCGTVVNTATITTTNEGSDQSTASVDVLCPSIHVTKTPDATDVSAGDVIGFTVTLSNSGAGTAQGLALADPLPTGGGSLSWSISPSSAGWSISNGNLVYSPTTLASGGSTSAHVVATTTKADCGTVTNTATVTTTNGGSDQASATVNVHCADIHVTKIADATNANAGDQIGFTLTLSNTGSGNAYGVTLLDPLPAGGGSLSWSISPASAGWSISNGNLVYSPTTLVGGAATSAHVIATTAEADCGMITNTATVITTNDGSDQASAFVDVNCPPTANAGADQTVPSAAPVSLDGTGSSDPEGDMLTYGWTQTGGPTVTLSNATAAQPTLTAPTGPATLTFQLQVCDTHSACSSDSVTINVNAANNPPVANAGPDQTVDSGSTVILNGSGSFDPDPGDAVATYSWTQTAGTTVSFIGPVNTATPSFTAPTGPDTLTFELQVCDLENACSSDSTTVSVRAANHPPTANAGPDQTVDSGASVQLDGTASSDPDGDALTYGWTQTGGAAVALSDANAAQPTFTAPTGPDTLTFQLQVCDTHNACSSDSVTIDVNAPNHPPTASAGPDQTVDSGATVHLDGTGSSDPDADTLTYGWTQTSGPSVSLSGAATAMPSFTAPGGPATLDFELQVCDTHSACSTDDVTITVRTQYQILGFFSPFPQSKWKVGTTVPVKVGLTLNGARLSDTVAATLAPQCRVTFSAASSPAFGPICMKYDRTNHQFVYTWKIASNTRPAQSVPIMVTVKNSDGSTNNTLSEIISITGK